MATNILWIPQWAKLFIDNNELKMNAAAIFDEIRKVAPAASNAAHELECAIKMEENISLCAHPDPAFNDWVVRPSAEGPPSGVVVANAAAAASDQLVTDVRRRMEAMQAAIVGAVSVMQMELQAVHAKIDTQAVRIGDLSNALLATSAHAMPKYEI